MNEVQALMTKAIEVLRGQLQGIRGGTVTAGFVRTVKIPYYDQMTETGHLASVAESGGRVSIIPYDASFVGNLARLLKESGLNAYAFSKKEVIVNVPPVSGEQKKEVCAHVKQLGEDAKVSVRNIRKKAKQKLGRAELSKEELKQAEQELQAQTDLAIEEISQIVQTKTNNIMS